MKALERECPCFLCDSQAGVITGDDPSRRTTDYKCDKCGEYTFNDQLLTDMQNSQHWEQTRKDLARALQLGAVRNRRFETAQDVGIDLNRGPQK